VRTSRPQVRVSGLSASPTSTTTSRTTPSTPIQPSCSWAVVNQPSLPTPRALETFPRSAPVAWTPLVITEVILDHSETEAALSTVSTAIQMASPRRIGSSARPR
jgi:hypothetical protein